MKSVKSDFTKISNKIKMANIRQNKIKLFIPKNLVFLKLDNK
jgi:hypothetical protein